MHDLSIMKKLNGWSVLKDWFASMGHTVPEEDKKLERAAKFLKKTRNLRGLPQRFNRPWESFDRREMSVHKGVGWCRLSILQDQLSAPAVILKSIVGAKTGVVLIHPSEADPCVNGEQRFRTNHCIASFLDLRARAKIRQSVPRCTEISGSHLVWGNTDPASCLWSHVAMLTARLRSWKTWHSIRAVEHADKCLVFWLASPRLLVCFASKRLQQRLRSEDRLTSVYLWRVWKLNGEILSSSVIIPPFFQRAWRGRHDCATGCNYRSQKLRRTIHLTVVKGMVSIWFEATIQIRQRDCHFVYPVYPPQPQTTFNSKVLFARKLF